MKPIEDPVLYFAILFATILVVNIVVLFISDRIKRRKNVDVSVLGKIQFNPEVIKGFDNWLMSNISLYMVKYIEEKSGRELVTDEELSLNSEFGYQGIAYVNGKVIESIPNYYQDYMRIFYGESKLVEMIHSRVRAVFVEYITNQMKKRMGQGVQWSNSVEKQSPDNQGDVI